MLLLLLACTQTNDTALVDDGTRPWRAERPRLQAAPGELPWRRVIVHLHSPYSHDACDGQGWSEEQGVDLECLAELREGLCQNGIDAAFLTDHPDYAAHQPFQDMRHWQEGDRDLGPAAGWACPDGSETLVMPGFEDDLMPVGLQEPVADTSLYSQGTDQAIEALIGAGALVFSAHPEGRTREQLQQRQAAGASGFELFNLHAMFAPGIRSEALGLDAWSWTSDIAPFTDPAASAEPDLFFLAVHQEQSPSLAHLDAMAQEGHVVAVAGTDAHQNVLNLELRDGERGDSYRRMLSWFSNWVVSETAEPLAIQSGLGQGAVAVVFESLGTPASLELLWEGSPPGTQVSAGTLSVPCVVLDSDSPQGDQPPEILASVLKDGIVVAEGCGEHSFSEPGAYRAVYEIVPWHLRPFLGAQPELYMHAYPWIYSNPWWLQG